jgi:hypothetical protein
MLWDIYDGLQIDANYQYRDEEIWKIFPGRENKAIIALQLPRDAYQPH